MVWNFYCNSSSDVALPGGRQRLHFLRPNGWEPSLGHKLSKDNAVRLLILMTPQAYPIHSICFKTSSQEKARAAHLTESLGQPLFYLLPLTPRQVSHREKSMNFGDMVLSSNRCSAIFRILEHYSNSLSLRFLDLWNGNNTILHRVVRTEGNKLCKVPGLGLAHSRCSIPVSFFPLLPWKKW